MSSYQCDPFSFLSWRNEFQLLETEKSRWLTGWPSDLNFRKVPKGLHNFPRPHLEVDEAIVVLEDFAGALGELGGVTGKEVGRDMELDGNLGTDIGCELPWKKNQGTCQPQRFVNAPCSFHPREIGGKHFFGIQHHVVRWTMIGHDI